MDGVAVGLLKLKLRVSVTMVNECLIGYVLQQEIASLDEALHFVFLVYPRCDNIWKHLYNKI